jgi:hypothetical protein
MTPVRRDRDDTLLLSAALVRHRKSNGIPVDLGAAEALEGGDQQKDTVTGARPRLVFLVREQWRGEQKAGCLCAGG